MQINQISNTVYQISYMVRYIIYQIFNKANKIYGIHLVPGIKQGILYLNNKISD